MEMLYTVAGWRAPFVLVNVSRGVAAPITLEADHQDVFAARDCGFLQIHCASAQEVLDAVLFAHRWSEDARVRLPVIVNLDGFTLSFTREPVELPSAEQVDRFLPACDLHRSGLRASKPVSRAVAVLGGGPYSYFRYEMHRAAESALAVYEELAADFERCCGRHWPLVETHRSEDAEVILFLVGSFAGKARDAVDRLRADGLRIGLVRPRVLRPYPASAIRAALRGARAVAVLDQNLSLGQGGVLHSEITAALYGHPDSPPMVASFIGGLGGRDVALEEFREMAKVALAAADAGVAPPARLLYTASELRELRKLQGIASAERHDLARELGES
jgi:pyruvate ferredoxin oxidoreductase alpha subunit